MELGSKRFADAVVLYPVGRIDHATAEGFDTAAAVEDRPVGGLGVLLVSAMARQVEYRRVGDKNRITLVIGG